MRTRTFQITVVCAVLLCSCAQIRRLEKKEAAAALTLVTSQQPQSYKKEYDPNWMKVKKPFSNDALYF